MVKILALHGFAQNPEELSSKLVEIQSLLPGTELVLPAASVGLISYDPADIADRHRRISGVPTRFSWNFPCEDQSSHLINVDACAEKLLPLLQYHAEVLKAPFDGVVGFSQGAACASAISALLEQVNRPTPPSQATALLVKHETLPFAHPTFKFAVLFCGARPSASTFDWLYDDIETPSLHLIGQRDIMVPLERSEQLAASFRDGKTLYHPGNHFIPTAPRYTRAVADFISREAQKPFAMRTVVSSTKEANLGGRMRSGLKRFSIELRDLCEQLTQAPLSPLRATTFAEVDETAYESPRRAPPCPTTSQRGQLKKPRFILRRKTTFQSMRLQMTV